MNMLNIESGRSETEGRMIRKIQRKDVAGRDARNEEWRKLKRKGMSYSAIARRYGVNHATVMYALKIEYQERKQVDMENYNLRRRGEYLARLELPTGAAE